MDFGRYAPPEKMTRGMHFLHSTVRVELEVPHNLNDVDSVYMQEFIPSAANLYNLLSQQVEGIRSAAVFRDTINEDGTVNFMAAKTRPDLHFVDHANSSKTEIAGPK